jgi:P-type Mg2+ transporter
VHEPVDSLLILIAAADDRGDAFGKVDEIPYEFLRRRVTTAVEDADGAQLLVKGALSQLLEVCATVTDGDGRTPLRWRSLGIESRRPGCS